jgi:hypothetical protein
VTELTTLAINPNKGSRESDLLRDARHGVTSSWTCNKTSQPGDVHLFYFAAPALRISAVGVCDQEPREDEGEFDWTARTRQWFARYRPLAALTHPITADDLKQHPVLSRWWAERPYRGMPKRLNGPAATAMVALISKHNPKAARLFRGLAFEEKPLTPKEQSEETRELYGRALSREGQRRLLEHYRAERSSSNRDRVLAGRSRPYTCEACERGFGNSLGKEFADLIHVHHRIQVSLRARTPRKGDFLLLCPNCHALAHWKRPLKPRDLPDLKRLARRAQL